VQQVRAEVEKIRPSTTFADSVYVNAPVAKNINFTFTSLSPDSVTLRQAIETSLIQFFKEIPNVGETLMQDSYRSAIYRTINSETGEFVRFELSEPIGDILVAANELPLLGTITYNIVP
jgi:hypothetical protein